jgi:hypothetical protein
MKPRNLILTLFFAFLCAQAASAANVSLMVMETGDGSGKWNGLTEWESGMMDVFFDAGHIVSSAKDLMLGKEPATLPPQVYDEMNEAVSGQFDYFVVVTVNIPKAKEPGQIGKITMQLFNIDLQPAKLIYSDLYTWVKGSKARPVYFNAQKAAERLVPYLRS